MKSVEQTLLLFISCTLRNPLKSSVRILSQITLILVPDRKADWDNIYYVAWLDMIMGGIKGLQYFNPENKVWG